MVSVTQEGGQGRHRHVASGLSSTRVDGRAGGRVAVVTGASVRHRRGDGARAGRRRACAWRCARDGASVSTGSPPASSLQAARQPSTLSTSPMPSRARPGRRRRLALGWYRRARQQCGAGPFRHLRRQPPRGASRATGAERHGSVHGDPGRPAGMRARAGGMSSTSSPSSARGRAYRSATAPPSSPSVA